MKLKFIVLSICLTFVNQILFAYTDLSLFLGNGQAIYSEKSDQISDDVTFTESQLALREIELISFLDFGVEVGGFAFTESYSGQAVQFQSEYLNIITGLTYPLFKRVLEINLDLGYKFSSNSIRIERSISNNTSTNQFDNQKKTDFISKIGLKMIINRSLLVGLVLENDSRSVQEENQEVSPEIKRSNSYFLTIGYRFGQKKFSSGARSGLIHDLDCHEFNFKECLR